MAGELDPRSLLLRRQGPEEAAFVWGSTPASLPAGATSPSLSLRYNLAKAILLEEEEGGASLC